MKNKREITQVEIIQGMHDIWINFRDALDVQFHLLGHVYRNPTAASIRRLARVLTGYPVSLVPDDKSFIVQIIVPRKRRIA